MDEVSKLMHSLEMWIQWQIQERKHQDEKEHRECVSNTIKFKMDFEFQLRKILEKK